MLDLKRALASLLAFPLLALAGCATNDALWHANADTDVDQGDHTRFFGKEVTSGDWTRLAIVPDPVGTYGEV